MTGFIRVFKGLFIWDFDGWPLNRWLLNRDLKVCALSYIQLSSKKSFLDYYYLLVSFFFITAKESAEAAKNTRRWQMVKKAVPILQQIIQACRTKWAWAVTTVRDAIIFHIQQQIVTSSFVKLHKLTCSLYFNFLAFFKVIFEIFMLVFLMVQPNWKLLCAAKIAHATLFGWEVWVTSRKVSEMWQTLSGWEF